jgi:ABC-2 type transport system ATP-binding protein
LTKTFGVLHAVRHVDLDVYRGECVTVLGPNGAGKTTMMAILEGYRRADAGTVRVLGVDPARAGRAWRERIGIVAQSGGPILGLSVWETLTHWAGFYRAARDPAEVMAAVGLEHKADAPVRALSGGLRRRLELALAIVGRPELLFLDEPTANLDPVARRSFWQLIRDLQGAGATVLLTTHFLDEADRLADRLVLMAAGRVIAADTPANLGGAMRLEAMVRWREDGVPCEEQTDNPVATVLALSERLGQRVDDLRIARPTLEDAYFALLGRLSSARGDGAAHPSGTDTIPAGER